MPIVASRNLGARDPGRGQFSIRIEIGQPYRCAENDWACSIALDGLYEHLFDQHGTDSFHALMLTLNLARTLLNDFVREGGQLFDVPAGTQVDVDSLFATGEVA